MAQSKMAQDFKDGPAEFAAALVIQSALIFLSFKGAEALQLGTELVILVTGVMGAFSWLVSKTVPRVLLLRERQPLRAKTAASLGCVFLLMEAALTHIGLDYLATKTAEPLFPLWTLWPASLCLSAANMLVKWVFIGRCRSKPRNVAPVATTKRAPAKLRAVG